MFALRDMAQRFAVAAVVAAGLLAVWLNAEFSVCVLFVDFSNGLLFYDGYQKYAHVLRDLTSINVRNLDPPLT